MLQELRCDQFIDKVIVFDRGLNAVLGDDSSTNSIGKSTLLMIIDFVFGGGSYLDNDSGSISNVGHQTFNFKLQFGSESKYFKRQTENPSYVFRCDSEYNIISETSVESYTDELKLLYHLPEKITFRSAVSLYSRIWKKDNCYVDKPLKGFSAEKDVQSITTIIKLFNLYNKIEVASSIIKHQEGRKKVIADLHRKDFVEKLNKTSYEENLSKLNLIGDEVKNIQENLLKFTLNIEELSSKELISLKTDKSRLLKSEDVIQNKIKRIELNLEQQSIKSRHLRKLSTFFSSANEEKIEQIESFHNKIGAILKRELTSAKNVLVEQSQTLQSEINVLDVRISQLLQNVDTPKYIVEKIYDLTVEANKISVVNKYYEQKIELDENLKALNENLDTTITEILEQIETSINTELIDINNRIHSAGKKIPRIVLKKKSYLYDHSDNTGTGKSFADLIEFDLVILKLTSLPFIIHDSILFKNIEDLAVDKILIQYQESDKQIFIALDGIGHYSNESQAILNSRARLNLSNSRKLFDKDWS